MIFPAVTLKQKQVLNHPTIPLWGFIFEVVTCFNFVVISDLTNMTLWTSGGCLQLWYLPLQRWISVQTSAVIKWLQWSPTTSFLEARRPCVTQNPMKPGSFSTFGVGLRVETTWNASLWGKGSLKLRYGCCGIPIVRDAECRWPKTVQCFLWF